ncbi:hypothetical protein ISCGN_003489 [Ixodes scapularis]
MVSLCALKGYLTDVYAFGLHLIGSDKIVDFQAHVSSLPAGSIVLLTETWLDASVADSELIDTDAYTVFRRDRGGRGGGVLLAFPASAHVTRRTDLEHQDLEALFVELRLPRSTTLVGCVYCPPSTREESYRLFDVVLQHASRGNYANTLLFGDFNAHIDWVTYDDPVPRDQSDDLLLDIATSAGLTQTCFLPTYTTREGAPSFLDLLFVADPTRIISCETSEGLPGSDHLAVEVTYAATLPRRGYHARMLWNCETALATLSHFVSNNLDNRTETDLVQLDLSNAFDTLDTGLLLKKVAKAGVQGSLLKWITNFLRDRSQRVVYRGACSVDTRVPSGVPQGSLLAPTLFLMFVNDMPQDDKFLLVQYADDTSILAPLVSPATHHHLQDYLIKIGSWASQNLLCLSPAKSSVLRFSSSHRVEAPTYSLYGAPLVVNDRLTILGVTFTRTLDFSTHVAGVVAKARRTMGFVSRVSKPCGPLAFRTLYTSIVLPMLEYCSAVWSPSQQHLATRIESVQRRATRTFCARATGAADTHYETRLNIAGWRSLEQRRSIARMRLLCRVLDGSLSGTYLSTAVRLNRRTGQPEPLHTRTKRQGLSLLPAAIGELLSVPLKERQPLPRCREESLDLCKNCETALATLSHFVSNNLDNRTETDLVQLDLSNAFDTLDTGLLLKKVAKAGVQGSLLKWITNFLRDRSQRVVYRGACSVDTRVPSGVPQGSLLAPTLFLMFVNDMPQDDKFLLVQYADDTSILAPLVSPATHHHLQDYLIKIGSWASQNLLCLSPAKSSVLRFSSSHRVEAPTYSLYGAPLVVNDRLTILGVTFTRTLDFSTHVAGVVAKARRTMGFVSRVSKPCGPLAFRTLYTSIVLPMLEYCSAVWSPSQQHLATRIESVQRRATRTFCARATGAADTHYETRLNIAGWRSLEQRRSIARMRLLCRVLDGSLSGTYLSTAVRLNRRTGQPEPLHTRTKRQGLSLLPAAIGELLSVPLKERQPLPRCREESLDLCKKYGKLMSAGGGT